MADSSLGREEEHRFASERIRYEWMLASLQKFRLFFAGLVFAILSFSVQFAIKPSNNFTALFQLFSWLSLLLTGILALRDAGGFFSEYTERAFQGLKPEMRHLMWILFVSAIFMLILVRVGN
jgi:hypothetical protein